MQHKYPTHSTISQATRLFLRYIIVYNTVEVFALELPSYYINPPTIIPRFLPCHVPLEHLQFPILKISIEDGQIEHTFDVPPLVTKCSEKPACFFYFYKMGRNGYTN